MCSSDLPDLSRVVVTRIDKDLNGSLEVYDVSTGSCLARVGTIYRLSPHFTRDGREVWTWNFHSSLGHGEAREIIKGGIFGVIVQDVYGEVLSESSRGYAVTDDWWVLSPSKKRLLWLPHRWRMGEWNRAWGGRFLGLLNGELLSEVVVLEFLE